MGLPTAGRQHRRGVRAVAERPPHDRTVVEFLVEDVAAATEELRAAGVPIVLGPVRAEEVGLTWTHVRAPDGNPRLHRDGRRAERPGVTRHELRLASAPVGQYSRQEVAGRAGVDPDYVDRLVELGILRAGGDTMFSTGDVRRARWVQSFERAGVPLEGIAAAVRDWSTLVLLPGRDRVRSVRGGERDDVPRTERTDGCALGPAPGGPGGSRLRRTTARGSRPRGRADDRPADRAPALLGYPAGGDRAIGPSVRGRPSQDRRDRDGLV